MTELSKRILEEQREADEKAMRRYLDATKCQEAARAKIFEMPSPEVVRAKIDAERGSEGHPEAYYVGQSIEELEPDRMASEVWFVAVIAVGIFALVGMVLGFIALGLTLERWVAR